MLVYNGVYLWVQYGVKEFTRKNGKEVFKFLRRSATVVAVVDEKAAVRMKDREVLAKGEAFCSLEDNFSRAKGRKLATARCIMGLWDEETRKAFWGVYVDKFGKEG